MVSTIVASVLHTLFVSLAVYVPAYTMQSSLLVTMGAYALALFILNIVYKKIMPPTPSSMTTTQGVISMALGLIPIILVGMKFGWTGAGAFIVTGIAVSVLTMYI